MQGAAPQTSPPRFGLDGAGCEERPALWSGAFAPAETPALSPSLRHGLRSLAPPRFVLFVLLGEAVR